MNIMKNILFNERILKLSYKFPPINIYDLRYFEYKNNINLPEDFKYYLANISSCVYSNNEINLYYFINKKFPFINNFDYDTDTKKNHLKLGKCSTCFNSNYELKKYTDIDMLCFDCKGILIKTLDDFKRNNLIYNDIKLDDLFDKYYFDYGPSLFNGILKLYDCKYDVIGIVINGEGKGQVWEFLLDGEIYTHKIADNFSEYLDKYILWN